LVILDELTQGLDPSARRSVWSSVDRVQVFTERDADHVRRLAPSSARGITVNPFGVDVSPAGATVAEDPRAIVFVGGFRHPPNVDAAIWLAREIMPLVRASQPRATLTIVGADPPLAVTGLASDGVTVTGRVASVEPFLGSAAVVAAPVRSGGGMRRKVLEAMALGRAVVTTTRGAEGIWNPPQAPTLRVENDAAGIARQITALLSAPAERAALGAAARAAVVAHHDRSRFAERLLTLYESLRRPGVAA
jgi:glycosyltransferase involved in cell wall biosynthesis